MKPSSSNRSASSSTRTSWGNRDISHFTMPSHLLPSHTVTYKCLNCCSQGAVWSSKKIFQATRSAHYHLCTGEGGRGRRQVRRLMVTLQMFKCFLYPWVLSRCVSRWGSLPPMRTASESKEGNRTRSTPAICVASSCVGVTMSAPVCG